MIHKGKALFFFTPPTWATDVNRWHQNVGGTSVIIYLFIYLFIYLHMHHPLLHLLKRLLRRARTHGVQGCDSVVYIVVELAPRLRPPGCCPMLSPALASLLPSTPPRYAAYLFTRVPGYDTLAEEGPPVLLLFCPYCTCMY